MGEEKEKDCILPIARNGSLSFLHSSPPPISSAAGKFKFIARHLRRHNWPQFPLWPFGEEGDKFLIPKIFVTEREKLAILFHHRFEEENFIKF
jgi:hypothetical protein